MRVVNIVGVSSLVFLMKSGSLEMGIIIGVHWKDRRWWLAGVNWKFLEANSHYYILWDWRGRQVEVK